MPTPREQLTALWQSADPFDYAPGEIAGVQLAAAADLVEERRAAIRVLDRRARESGIDAITQRSDLVPLLFSHSTYKSYPDAFVRDGRWERMSAWLRTLSCRDIEVDVSGATDIDQWMELLHAAAHHVMSTSGTSGRTSFLATSAADHDALRTGYVKSAAAMVGAHADVRRTALLAMPRGHTTVAQMTMVLFAGALAEGTPRYLTDEPLRAADVARMGRLRQAIADGTADPGDIAAAEATAREREAAMGAQLGKFVDAVLDRHEEPLLLAGTFGLLWKVVEAAQERGIPDGAFCADTILLTGGGLKGVQAPPDVRERVRAFFGPAVGQFEAYGMSELTGPFARCAQGRYHVPPTTLLLLLDKAGETLVQDEAGTVVARCAALDLLVDDRWGGVISGDQVTVCLDPCACGRASAQVVDIVRYSDLPEGDDKLSCAGTMDAYVRGEIEATA